MGHGLIWWIVVGLCAGALAKAIAPGSRNKPSGCLMTILLGVAGSVAMGFVMELAGFKGDGGLLPTIGGATIGAVALLWITAKLSK
jgi:uncharacterized membrane protein YeaQ/YmgE (transglycosylase-associated protein family)